MGCVRIVGIIIATALAASPAHAEAPPGLAGGPPGPVTETITLEALLVRLRGTVELRSAEARVAGASATVRERLPWAPNPELEAELAVAPDGDAHATVALHQTLPLFAERGAGRRAAREVLAATRAERDASLRERARAAAERLVAVGHGQARIEVEDEAARLAEELAAAAERRARAGEIAPDEAALARLEATLAQARREATRSEVERLALAACRALERDRCAGVAMAPPSTEVPTLEAIIAEALGRDDVRAAEHRVEAARHELVFARGEARVAPTLGLGVEREVGDHSGVVWRVTGAIALPLPLWDPRAGAVDREAAALREVEAERDVRRLDVEYAVRAAYAEHAAARSAEAALVDTAATTDALRASTREAYDTGAYSIERALALYDRLLAARRALIDARWRTIAARISLELERPLP